MNQKTDKQELFLELFEPLKERLWRFCLSVSMNYEDARELLSETIFQSYLNFEKVRNNVAFLSFIFTIASRVNNNNRIKHSRIDYLEPEDLDSLVVNSETPENILEIKELYKALGQMPAEQKEAIILFDIMGFSRTEICEIQNTNLDNVKARLYRGRKKLAEILGVEINNQIDETKHDVSLTGTKL
jgi:RNA polymerase sigma-70 factor, ECF subfamily